jgi:hypothetical protein
VSDRGGRVAEPVVDARQVVVRVGRVGRRGERLLVGRARLGEAAEVLERDAQVEGRRRVVGADRERRAIVPFGLAQVAGLVLETAEIHVGVRVLRIDLEGPLVGCARLGGIALLDLAAERVPAVGRGGELDGGLARLAGTR